MQLIHLSDLGSDHSKQGRELSMGQNHEGALRVASLRCGIPTSCEVGEAEEITVRRDLRITSYPEGMRLRALVALEAVGEGGECYALPCGIWKVEGRAYSINHWTLVQVKFDNYNSLYPPSQPASGTLVLHELVDLRIVPPGCTSHMCTLAR